MRGRLIDLSIGLNRKQRITIEVDRDFREDFDRLREAELDVEIKKHRNRHSLSANAYFHVLVSKIAAERGGSEESTIYPYVKCFDTREENGKMFNCYLVYKQTHLMDTKEMARLIDGAVEKARELGIETDTPEQLARYKEDWNKQ